MKTKQEREMVVIKSEMDVLKAQNTKYEEHTRKLSNQIVRLNDNILQHQKENAILSTNLKHIMEQQKQQQQDNEKRNKRSSSIYVSTISSLPTGPIVGGGPKNIGADLAMEDEEGEVFNNTYLTDMKNGYMSELMSRDVCVEELKYRNSLLPPHLRSTYAAQFDHELSEDDLKDGPHSFDDSMSALLSTTAGGTRKKCTGVTHYKRPGPPTPSKNGGRLSFGGISEPSREILKESYDTNSVSSSKTPARFNFFASRFSMGPNKDEKLIAIKKGSEECTLRKSIYKPTTKGNKCKLLREVVYCTSTPRKSKVHFDQRRLLDHLMKSSPSPLALDNQVKKVENKSTPPDQNISETPLTTLGGHEKMLKSSGRKSIIKRLEAIASGLRRNRRNSCMFGRRLSRRMKEICTPSSSETASSALKTPLATNRVKKQVVVVSSSVTTSGGISKTLLLKKRLCNRSKPEKKTRPSLCFRGNIFAKYNCRTPNKVALHDWNRYKSRKQRCEHFNQGRNIKSFTSDSSETEEPDETLSNCQKNATYDLRNNNYGAIITKEIIAAPVLVAKCEYKNEKKPEDTFTFGEEQFENPNILDFSEKEEEILNEETDEEKEISDNDADNVNFSFRKVLKQEELVTSQDLDNFDRLIAAINKEENFMKDGHLSQTGNSQHFEKLLTETQSNAPFDVNHTEFDASKNSHSTNSYRSSLSNHSCPMHSHSSHTSNCSSDCNQNTISTAKPHFSPNNATCQLSRTIYGGTVIYNHRLPNINTTYVRKSSIYIKNYHRSSDHHHDLELSSSACNDVILVTNQTITVVDILRMWSQMDNTTRLIISFAILASFTSLFGLLVSFCSRR